MNASESTLHSCNTVCFGKFQHTPATLLWSKRHLGLHCHLANLHQDQEESAKEKKKTDEFLHATHSSLYLYIFTLVTVKTYSCYVSYYKYLKPRSVFMFTLYYHLIKNNYQNYQNVQNAAVKN